MKKGEKFIRIQISEEEYKQLLEIEKKTVSKKILKRIQAFKLLYKKWKYSQIAQAVSIRNNTFTGWIKLYKEGGLDKVLSFNYKGGQSKLTNEQLVQIKNKIEKEGFAYAKEVKQYINSEFNISYHLHHIQKLLKKKFNLPLKSR